MDAERVLEILLASMKFTMSEEQIHDVVANMAESHDFCPMDPDLKAECTEAMNIVQKWFKAYL